MEIPTPHGPARAHLRPAGEPRGALVLGHGAAGSVSAPDLVAATDAALGCAVSVALVEQPYLVAGRRSAAPAAQLDAAWLAVLEALRAGPLGDLPLVTGGRSSGARVACRTSEQSGVVGVLCLAFPLQPPQRRTGAAPPSRQGELDAVSVPVLVVQGAGDPFGMPAAGPDRTVVQVPGNHSLRSSAGDVAAAVRDWLPRVLRL